MYETVRIIDRLKPKYVIWENVKNLLSKKHRHNFDNYLERMENMGYRNYYQVLNAKDYGIPQNRERVFTISIRNDIEKDFKFPEKEELKLKLKDTLESEVDEKYYLSDKGIKYVEKREGGYTQLADEQTEVAHCPITAKGNNNWTGKFIKQVGQMYGTEREPNPQAGRIYDCDGISPAMDSCSGGNRMPKILIKNNTQQGYLEAHEGDGVYTNTSTKRGTVQPQIAHTLTSFQDAGVVTAVAQRGRENGQQIEVSNRDYANAITSVQKDSMVVVKNKDKRLKELVEKTKFEKGKVLNMDLYNQTTNENISQCLTEPNHNSQRLYDGLRIRKLTPKECWRLMGFTDEEFEKAEKVNSNSQLYKQAGNSIVVNVLEKILDKLLGEEKCTK